MIAAWQNLDKFQGDARFGTWFRRIAANAALAIHRRRASRVSTDFTDPADLHQFATTTVPPVADRVVDTDAVRRALATLPDDFREAIVLREYGDMSYAEIAEHQSIGIQTVKSPHQPGPKTARGESGGLTGNKHARRGIETVTRHHWRPPPCPTRRIPPATTNPSRRPARDARPPTSS